MPKPLDPGIPKSSKRPIRLRLNNLITNGSSAINMNRAAADSARHHPPHSFDQLDRVAAMRDSASDRCSSANHIGACPGKRFLSLARFGSVLLPGAGPDIEVASPARKCCSRYGANRDARPQSIAHQPPLRAGRCSFHFSDDRINALQEGRVRSRRASWLHHATMTSPVVRFSRTVLMISDQRTLGSLALKNDPSVPNQ